MNRNARRVVGARLFACLALLSGMPATASALPLISEVFYDAVGSDDGQGFVEISGAPGTDLTGLFIEGINGSGGGVTVSIPLSGVIPADGLLVLADDQGDGTTLVPNADLIDQFDFQNGPDSIVLTDGVLAVDAVGYGAFGPGDVFAGEGTPVEDPPAGWSIARWLADVDTDDNATDFTVLDVPTPGVAAFQTVPEPGSGVLAGGGLAAIAWLRRGRRVARRISGAGGA
jgi:hypothetical protein